jgi:hypothetical protein
MEYNHERQKDYLILTVKWWMSGQGIFPKVSYAIKTLRMDVHVDSTGEGLRLRPIKQSVNTKGTVDCPYLEQGKSECEGSKSNLM